MQDFVKAVQQESDQVASELQKVLANLEPLLQERRRLEQRAKALESVISTYEAGHVASGDSVGALLHEHPEDIEPGFLRERSERGDHFFTSHISRSIEI